jgi:hypothetical protein
MKELEKNLFFCHQIYANLIYFPSSLSKTFSPLFFLLSSLVAKNFTILIKKWDD